jgi:hypothetical protein
MKRNTIILGLVAIAFLVGLMLCAVSVWWLFGLAGISADEHFV